VNAFLAVMQVTGCITWVIAVAGAAVWLALRAIGNRQLTVVRLPPEPGIDDALPRFFEHVPPADEFVLTLEREMAELDKRIRGELGG
jgi:hypothetical protein